MYPHPRFLRMPELRNAERWRFVGIIDHPFYKHGPLYQWRSSHGRTVMINRQLFRMSMTGRMEMEKKWLVLNRPSFER